MIVLNLDVSDEPQQPIQKQHEDQGEGEWTKVTEKKRQRKKEKPMKKANEPLPAQ